MSEEASVKLAVTVTKNPGRAMGYTATYGRYPYDIDAYGATETAAKANLAAKLATAITTMIEAKPRFARGDSDDMWAAVPAADGGSTWYRITSDGARLNSYTSHPAAEAFEAFDTCVGMTVIPSR